MKANYTYLSDGTKAAAYTSASAGKDYVGSFTYTRGSGGSKTLESVAFGGGRIRKTGSSSYAVDYHITDHLGSVRAIVNASGAIQEQNDYYPFGTRHPNGLPTLPSNRWRFGGKEEQDSFGIAYSDFGARLYDRSAAWTAMDPLAEKYYAVSPYVYCVGNPILNVDPEGNDWFQNTKTGELYYNPDYTFADLGSGFISNFKDWVFFAKNNEFSVPDQNLVDNFSVPVLGGGFFFNKNSAKTAMAQVGYSLNARKEIVEVTRGTEFFPESLDEISIVQESVRSVSIEGFIYVPQDYYQTYRVSEPRNYRRSSQAPFPRRLITETWEETREYTYEPHQTIIRSNKPPIKEAIIEILKKSDLLYRIIERL